MASGSSQAEESRKPTATTTAKRKLDEDPTPSSSKCRGGTIDYMVAHGNLPKGPHTLEDLIDWPSTLLRMVATGQGVEGVLRKRRVEAALQTGLAMHSDFSGRGSPEIATAMLGAAAHGLGWHIPGPSSHKWLMSWCTCDRGEAQQRFLLSLNSHNIFQDIMDFLPPQLREDVEALRPTAADTSKEAKKAKYMQQRELLQSRKHEIPTDCTTRAYCIAHDAMCRTTFHPLAHMDPPPLRTNFSGPECLPWTSMGSNLGYACETMEPYNAWLALVTAQRLSTVFIENSDKFPFEDFQASFSGEGFFSFKVVFSLSDLGVPLFRRRAYGVAINLNDLVWVGPTSPSAIQETFMQIFACQVEVDADIVAGADSPEQHQALLQHLGRRRGYYRNASDLQLGMLLPPGMSATWTSLREALGAGKLNQRMGFNGGVAADISQAGDRVRAGPWMPSPCKTSHMASVTQDKLFTCREVDWLMGWPSLPHAMSWKYKACIPSTYWDTSIQDHFALLGNSMSLQQIAAFQLFVYSHVIRRDRAIRMCPPLEVEARVEAQGGAAAGRPP